MIGMLLVVIDIEYPVRESKPMVQITAMVAVSKGRTTPLIEWKLKKRISAITMTAIGIRRDESFASSSEIAVTIIGEPEK